MGAAQWCDYQPPTATTPPTASAPTSTNNHQHESVNNNTTKPSSSQPRGNNDKDAVSNAQNTAFAVNSNDKVLRSIVAVNCNDKVRSPHLADGQLVREVAGLHKLR